MFENAEDFFSLYGCEGFVYDDDTKTLTVPDKGELLSFIESAHPDNPSNHDPDDREENEDGENEFKLEEESYETKTQIISELNEVFYHWGQSFKVEYLIFEEEGINNEISKV